MSEEIVVVEENEGVIRYEQDIAGTPAAIPPGLAQRLSRAAAQVQPAQLDGYNAYHRYRYQSIGEVRAIANRALADAGVSIVLEIADAGRSARTSEAGKAVWMTFVKLVIHVSSPDGYFRVGWVGESEDTSDKGIAKAVSSGLKSWLLNSLLIPTAGEEENDDGGLERQRQPQQQPQRQPQQQPQRPQQPAPAHRERPARRGRPDTALTPDGVREFVAGEARRQSTHDEPATSRQVDLIDRLLSEVCHDSSAVIRFIFGKEADELSKAEAFAVLLWMLDRDGNGEHRLHPLTAIEVGEIMRTSENEA